jgi:hypothetical protein
MQNISRTCQYKRHGFAPRYEICIAVMSMKEESSLRPNFDSCCPITFSSSSHTKRMFLVVIYQTFQFFSNSPVSFCSNFEAIMDDPYWTSRKINLELTDLSGVNKVSLVQVSSCSNTGSMRDDPYWTSRKISLELTDLSGVSKVSLVQASSCSNTGSKGSLSFTFPGKRQVQNFLPKFSFKVFVSYFLSCVERIITHCSFKTTSYFILYSLIP